ncbi:hypothetical protein [Orlajensenia leifsoniae]|uniref:Uncharacterized protein n=1 Tax=Orlajensenia leifsoniae TaxID=2561933 RepID=A0A4Y9QZW7_9MICO|nr:hypothetical protein [Leifsonia flava]TFV98084.1 hypothetical protein E4M00_08590 [Leifsonia flava]
MAADNEVHGDEGDAVTGEGLDPRFDPRFQRGYSAPAPVGGAAAGEPRAEEKRPAGIDPRFDPRFQRGYDPERHQQLRRPIAADEVDDRPAFASTVKAGIPRPLDTPVSRPAARTPVRPAAASASGAAVSATSTAQGSTGPAAASVAEPDVSVDDRTSDASGAGSAASVGRNTYLLALWISCAALVVVGVVVIVQTATTTSGGGFGVSAFGDPFVVAVWVIAPPAVTVGLIGLVALTLSRALGWLADHPDRGDPGADAALYDADDVP